MLKKAYSFLLICFTTLSTLQAQTPVSGGIYANTTWTLANSPYLLTGPVVVFPGNTLTIEPGVEVRVEYDGVPNTGLMHYLEIRGSLVAVGTLSSPIVFRSDTLPTEYTWLGINVKSSQGGQVTMDYFELSNTVYGIYADQLGAPAWDLHNCKFSYNSYGVQPFGPINFYDCLFEYNGQAIGSGWQVNYNLLAKRCEFAHNTSCNGFQTYLSVDSCVIRDNMNGIWNTSASVTNNLFLRNTSAIYGVNGNVDNNTFEQNGQGLISFAGSADNCRFIANGLAAEVAAGGSVTNSTFENDTVAIAYASSLTASSTMPTVLLNRICGSVLYYVENRSDVNFALDQNCFCETDSTIIEGLIFDGYDDFTRGLFNYAIYDSTCQNVLQYVLKVALPTSTDEAVTGNFSLYPVPADEQITLSIPAELAGAELSAMLHDSQGRLIGESRRVDASTLAWDLSALPSGMYFVRVTGATSATLKFVK